jgi:hypothetical protein
MPTRRSFLARCGAALAALPALWAPRAWSGSRAVAAKPTLLAQASQKADDIYLAYQQPVQPLYEQGQLVGYDWLGTASLTLQEGAGPRREFSLGWPGGCQQALQALQDLCRRRPESRQHVATALRAIAQLNKGRSVTIVHDDVVMCNDFRFDNN